MEEADENLDDIFGDVTFCYQNGGLVGVLVALLAPPNERLRSWWLFGWFGCQRTMGRMAMVCGLFANFARQWCSGCQSEVVSRLRAIQSPPTWSGMQNLYLYGRNSLCMRCVADLVERMQRDAFLRHVHPSSRNDHRYDAHQRWVARRRAHEMGLEYSSGSDSD